MAFWVQVEPFMAFPSGFLLYVAGSRATFPATGKRPRSVSMSRMLFLVVFCAAFCLCETQLAGRASLDPLLTTISKAPELSSFYSLISSTGDDGKKPGPDLEERFNLREDSLNFTIFAPTNKVSHIALASEPLG